MNNCCYVHKASTILEKNNPGKVEFNTRVIYKIKENKRRVSHFYPFHVRLVKKYSGCLATVVH